MSNHEGELIVSNKPWDIFDRLWEQNWGDSGSQTSREREAWLGCELLPQREREQLRLRRGPETTHKEPNTSTLDSKSKARTMGFVNYAVPQIPYSLMKTGEIADLMILTFYLWYAKNNYSILKRKTQIPPKCVRKCFLIILTVFSKEKTPAKCIPDAPSRLFCFHSNFFQSPTFLPVRTLEITLAGRRSGKVSLALSILQRVLKLFTNNFTSESSNQVLATFNICYYKNIMLFILQWSFSSCLYIFMSKQRYSRYSKKDTMYLIFWINSILKIPI